MAENTQEVVRLKGRLGQARRAWKRNAALSGLVVVISEAAGVVGVAVLADVLFAPNRTGRMLLLGGAVAVTAYLTARHIVAPLFRRISDENLALYLEERTPAFEGALIAAVEFGDETQLPPQQARIVQSILHEAVARVERFDLRKALDLRRFHKYGVVALVLVAGYATLALTMPQTVGRHVARVVAPWKPTAEEIEARQKAAELNRPISFTLSRQDTSLLRGSAFDLEVTLSRKPEDNVYFHFRAYDPKSETAAWKQLPMKQAERLNGFDFALPDVNEDLEFFVAAGSHKSAAHRINVHDPLAILDTQVTIHYPAYLKRDDQTTQVQSPDVAALVGSTATIRFQANLPIREGTLVWPQGGQKPVSLVVDKTNPLVATASFEVTADAVYEYRLTDTNGQELQSPGPLTIRALQDKPPTAKLLTPEPMVTTHPLGEVQFSADVADDYGLAGAELVYYRGVDPAAPSAKVALKIAEGKADSPLMLEGVLPQAQPGDMFTCFVECTDLKGQKAVTDLVLVTVTPFDTWALWAPPEPEHAIPEKPSLTALLQATWSLHAQKPQLPPVQFGKQSEELAGGMQDAKSKELLRYVDTTHLSGEALEHAKKAIALIQTGHGDLRRHATDSAIGDFRAALGEMAAAGLSDVVELPPPPPPSAAAAVAENMKQLDMKPEAPAAAMAAPPAKPEQEQANAKAAAQIQEQQQNLVEKLKQQAKKDPDPAAQKQEQKNAAAQKELAAKAQAAAEQLKGQKAPEAAEKLANAARTMHEAAKALEQGQKDKGTQKAEDASRQLAAVVADLKGQSQEQIEKLLNETERAAQQAKQEQAEVRKKTQAVAAAVEKAPDAKQQREIKEAAVKQAQVTARVEQVNRLLEQLKQVGANGQMKAETAKQVEEANLAMKRQRVAQKAANAAVELAAGNPKTAAAEQEKTEAGLAKVLEAVRAANDARATGHEAELKRAKGEADRIKEAVAQTAQKRAQPQEKKEAVAKASEEAQRLARHLNQRDLFKGNPDAQKDAKRLEELVANLPVMQAQLETQQETSEFAKVTARLQNRLEAEYEALMAARNLFASQREECPPEYRQLVNQYFEALSNQK